MTSFLDTPVDKSLSATDAWTDIDLSSDIPASATGAIFQVINTSGSNDYGFGLRKKGSTDDRYLTIWRDRHSFCIIGVDTNRKCQGKIYSTSVDFHLVGYTESDATLFTNAYDKSQSTTGSWTDLDLSGELPAGAVAAIFQVVNTDNSNSRSWGLRKKGSTDDRYNNLSLYSQIWFLIGVDSNRKCQFKIETTNIDFFLVGYLSSGTAETNGINRSLGSAGSYIDITESSAPSGATGAFIECLSSALYAYGARKNGLSWDKYKDITDSHVAIFVGLDGDKKWEGKIENTGVDFYTLGYFAAGVITKTFTADTILEATQTKTFTVDVILVNRNTKTFTADVILVNRNTKTFTANVILVNRNTKTFTADTLLEVTQTKTFTADTLLEVTQTKTFTADVILVNRNTKIFTANAILEATQTKTFTADTILVEQYTKTFIADTILEVTQTKTFTADTLLEATQTKTFTVDVISVNRNTKTFTADVILVNRNTKTFTSDLITVETAEERGFYYAKLGSTILTGLEKDSFRITEELNKIPSFEFEIANCSDNRTTIAAGITDVFRIYRLLNGDNTLIFTGIINGDAIEYLSLERIRITGYASFIDLNWRFHQHLNSADAETVDKVYNYTGSYSDKTTEANNDTINDVPITYSSVNDALYIGQSEQFFGMQIKYSTKGVQAASTTVVWEYSKGSSVWATLDVLDETRTFTEAVGTHYITIPHKPSDWAKDTVNSVKKFWIRARLSAGSYTTPPALDRIKIINIDVYRVYYFETAADTIMTDVLAGTGYSMDVTDVCPSDTISIVAEYETKLRIIAGIANALTWDDSGDKKAYQWWIDTSKKVHFKQKRGATLGDITGDLTILNNIEDYFNLSNRLHFFGNYDGLNQLKAVIENTDSQDTHEIRELAVPEERYNNYIPLKEAAQKAMTYTKAPLQKIAATVTTKYWLDSNFEVGDTVTLHATSWDVASQAFQIVRADIGPRVTNLDMGVSQEHLDGLKAGLQRQLDITGIRMHGSTSLLQFGPEEMNYQRVDGSTVYPARMKFEIPSETRYIHKITLSWKLGPYRSSVGGSSGDTGTGDGHDHTGHAGSGGAFTPDVLDGGAHTPTELGKGGHDHQVNINPHMGFGIKTGYLLTDEYMTFESSHSHSIPATDGPDDNDWAIISLSLGSGCVSGNCVTGSSTKEFSESSHWHLNTGKFSGSGSAHRHFLTVNASASFVLNDISFSAFDVPTEPDHTHTINLVADHPHTGVAEPAHSDHVVVTEPGSSLPLDYDIKEIAGGTIMELIVNGETVASNYDGDQADIIITGYTTTGSNTIEIQPAVGQNHKGSANIDGKGTIFIEAKKW